MPRFSEQLVERLRDVGVLGRSDLREHLDDGDLGPERPVDAGELEPDVVAADDDDRRRDVLRDEPVVRVVDLVAVGLDERKVARERAGGQNDPLLGLEAPLAVGGLDHDRPLADELPLALDELDLALL